MRGYGLPHAPSRRHADLGPEFYDLVEPARFPAHILRFRNQEWADRVGLGDLTDADWIDHFGRFVPLPGSFEQPLALRYHGHQFRTYNPDLGDGRGFLFAQLHDLLDGRLLDLGTKGSGTTPWSRNGDGRLTLKGGVREVLATAMLEALGVYTSKSFSLIETGEQLVRGDEPSPTRSAILVRLSHTHIRIGSFQRFAYLQDHESLLRLLDHAIAVCMPDAWHDSTAERASAFLDQVCRNVARLGAQWMAAGFVHGVLNTDNINITGESFDYGPWRFAPTFNPEFTAAYFDHGGLYAFGRQPDTLLWNCVRLAECLLPLADKAGLEQALAGFAPAFRRELATAVTKRLGLRPRGETEDAALAQALWTFLQATQAPFEQIFFDLYGGLSDNRRLAASPAARFYEAAEFAAVIAAMDGAVPLDASRRNHPYFAGLSPCTMLIDEVERIWEPIATTGDWSLFQGKLAQIAELADGLGNRALLPHTMKGVVGTTPDSP
jgi:uncharacterized protein YdiU (UPF0061 family)